MFMVKTLFVAGAVSGIALAAATPAHGAQSASAVAPAHVLAGPRRSARVQQPLRPIATRLVRHGAPGALVVVRTPAGVRRAASGLGSREPRAALRATDRFRVASITKPFVATVVLQLVGEGRLALDDPLGRMFPGLVPNGGAITVRELLNHTSGLFDYQDDAGFDAAVLADPGHAWSPRELVAIAASHPPLFPPGRGWSYSNTNYVLLGLVIEAVTGTSLEHQLGDRLFRPLGLAATSLPSAPAIEGAHAHGYIGRATLPSLRSLLDVTEALSPSISWAAGAIVSNGDDVTRFFSRLLAGRLLHPALLKAMRTPAPGSSYGLGLQRTPTRCGWALGHQGYATGYRSVALGRANGRRVALVMVNVDTTRVSWAELRVAAVRAFCSG